MFTGLVEALGKVDGVSRRRSGARIAVRVPWPVTRGESVAVNGVCLTVVAPSDAVAAFDAVPETLSRTNLGTLTRGAFVNVERPLRAGDRLGGHFVQGHVDGKGTVGKLERSRKGAILRVRVDRDLALGMVPKGSVAVDGVSLTVVEAGDDYFTVALIPVTLRETTLGKARKGTVVNIELDMIGKHVERLVGRRKNGVSKELLKKAGFL